MRDEIDSPYLKNHAVDVDIALRQLAINVSVDVLGNVDGQVESHAGEALLESLLESILLVLLITSMPESNDSSLRERSLVDVVN